MSSFIDLLLEVLLLNIPETIIILGFCIPFKELKRISKSDLINIIMIMSALSSIMVRIIQTPYAQIIYLIISFLILKYYFDVKVLILVRNMMLCIFIVMPIVEIPYMGLYNHFNGDILMFMSAPKRFLFAIPFRIVEFLIVFLISSKELNTMKLWVGKIEKKKK